MKKIAGLDLGTTGCKITVFDEEGHELKRSYRTYPVSRKTEGHEIDASALLDGVMAVISDAAAEHGDIAGIGVTSFGETFVMTDKNGVPLAPAMLYTDPRGAEECRELAGKLGEDKIAGITGVVPHEMYAVPKMMWRKKQDPELFAKAEHLFLVQDFVIFALTGHAVIDYSLATRTMAFDIGKLDWSREVLQAAGIDMCLLSRPVPTGTDAGTVTKTAAEKTGLSPQTHIIAVSHDQVAAAVGAGAFDESVGVDGAGTVQCLTPVFRGMPDVRKMQEGKYAIVPYVVPGTFVTYAFIHTGGALLQWCTETLAKEEAFCAHREGISVNAYLEQQYIREKENSGQDPDEPSGLLLLPHFAGAATPYMDTGSKGALLGLTTETTAAAVYRACMEGVTYEMYLNYRGVAAAGAVPKKLNATGGGARSGVWMQMKADVLGLPVTALRTADAGTVGSAMLTGIALGIYRDLQDAAEHLIEEEKTYYPRESYHRKYEEVYARYKKVYQAVRDLIQV